MYYCKKTNAIPKNVPKIIKVLNGISAPSISAIERIKKGERKRK